MPRRLSLKQIERLEAALKRGQSVAAVSAARRPQGQYWVAPVAGGLFAVLWSHPQHPSWHRQIAAFPDRERAEAYAANEQAGIEQPLPEQDSLARRPRAPAPPVLGAQILQHIDALFAAFPKGIPAQAVATALGCSYEAALAALRWLHNTGRAQFLYRGDSQRNRKYLWPVGAAAPRQLSVNQEKVLEVLLQAAHNGIVSGLGYRDMARAAGITKATLANVLDALKTKGYLQLLQKGGTSAGLAGGEPSRYRVAPMPMLPAPEPAQAAAVDIAEHDLYPPEQREARFNAVLRTCARLPPADAEEAALRQSIAQEWERIYPKRKRSKQERAT